MNQSLPRGKKATDPLGAPPYPYKTAVEERFRLGSTSDALLFSHGVLLPALPTHHVLCQRRTYPYSYPYSCPYSLETQKEEIRHYGFASACVEHHPGSPPMASTAWAFFIEREAPVSAYLPLQVPLQLPLQLPYRRLRRCLSSLFVSLSLLLLNNFLKK